MKNLYILALFLSGILVYDNCDAQAYKAPQDTAKIKRAPNESLTTYSSTTQSLKSDSRLLGSAIKAASILADTTKYDNKKGIALEQLFSKEDLKYIAGQGVNGAVALFDLINQNLPMGEVIYFKTGDFETIVTDNNPLVLEKLRATVSENPATVSQPQWKENVYQAYIARDYGTKLFNTITITAATTEIQESPNLEIIDFDGKPITLAKVRSREKSESAAVANFRDHTYPNAKISEANARENYRRALFQLMTLQENDINQHAQSQKLITDLSADLRRGSQSNTLNAIQSSTFFDVNVKGSVGPMLLTESKVVDDNDLANNARVKAMGILMLVALHYGERDAVKLLNQLINGKGETPAQNAGFTAKRLNELTEHGAEKFKSLGFQQDKTQNMSSADLVLVAVASPAVMPQIRPNAYLGIVRQISQTIVNNYYSTTTTEENTTIRNTVLFNPRISLSSRHTEYREAYDPIDYVPEMQNGQFFDQRGSKVNQNGAELRLESDLYFSNAERIIKRGIKPVIYPEFGVLVGIGTRSVGYDQSTTAGPLGPVPQFRTSYTNWGAHLGINIGPILLATDATILTTPVAATPQEQFFDLSQGMTFYRYEFLTHVLNLGFQHNYRFTVDLDLVAETNNEGFGNLTSTQGTDAQIKSAKWHQDYDQVHAGGTYNQLLALNLLNNGYVKGSYPADNYAAFNIGIQKANFKLTGTAGLYNIHTRTGFQIYDHLLSNTLKGNLFGSIGLTYNFGSKSLTTKHHKKDAYQTGDPSHHIEDTSSNEETKTAGPRNHAIFTNKK